MRASQLRYVKFMGQLQLQVGSSKDCPHVFLVENHGGVFWCFDCGRATSADSAVAHVSDRRVSGLRQLSCSVMRSVLGGEAPFQSLPGTRA